MVITKAPCSGLCSAPLERKNNPSSNQWTDTEMGTGAARGKWEGFCQQKRQKPVKAMSSGTILSCYHRNHAKWQPSAFYYFITRLSLKRALFLFLVIVCGHLNHPLMPLSESQSGHSYPPPHQSETLSPRHEVLTFPQYTLMWWSPRDARGDVSHEGKTWWQSEKTHHARVPATSGTGPKEETTLPNPVWQPDRVCLFPKTRWAKRRGNVRMDGKDDS